MPIAAKTPEIDIIERDVAEADRASRIEHRLRVSPPNNYAEADRLAEVASAARVQTVLLGEMCFSLLRCRERATENGYADIVLLIQPKIDEYQDKLKVATDAYKAAEFESKSFDVRMAQ